MNNTNDRGSDKTPLASFATCLALIFAPFLVLSPLCGIDRGIICDYFLAGTSFSSGNIVNVLIINLLIGVWVALVLMSLQVFWLSLFAKEPFSSVMAPAAQLTFFVSLPIFVMFVFFTFLPPPPNLMAQGRRRCAVSF